MSILYMAVFNSINILEYSYTIEANVMYNVADSKCPLVDKVKDCHCARGKIKIKLSVQNLSTQTLNL